jgi:hypothetical protein
MAKRYGHIGQLAQRQAVAVLDVRMKFPSRTRLNKRGAQKRAQSAHPKPAELN